MKNFLKLSLYLSTIFFVACGASSDSSPERVSVFYLPFRAETYIPLTVDNIEEQAPCKFKAPRSGDAMQALTNSLERSKPGAFDRFKVRLKVIGLKDHDLFVDQAGGVLLGQDGEERTLLADDLARLEESMRALARESGCAFGTGNLRGNLGNPKDTAAIAAAVRQAGGT